MSSDEKLQGSASGSARTLRLGWKAGTEQYPPDELLEYAVAAERAGFDCIGASDHFHPWAEKGQASFVWSWLGAVAASTTKIVLGTGLTCPILRYHPAVIAQAAATMACLAARRFYLGVGTGEALNEYAATGEWPAYNFRGARLEEAIPLMRGLWTGEKITHAGDYYATKRIRRSSIRDRASRSRFMSRHSFLTAHASPANTATV